VFSRCNGLVSAVLLTILFALDTHTLRPAPAAPKALGACSAVTRADVEIALGRKFAREAEETANGPSTCDCPQTAAR
jgi:hypothetical protein